ncbi:MAG: phosphoribosylformylglycinamidine synthase subunit PurQ [Phycisphaerales bacterium]|nr:phosphoribosylformylglycinamidine synthase subunit PurQ [Phycisphaerales bacterium]
MSAVRVLILRAAGINCDLETEFAWRKVGAETARVHIRQLIEAPKLLNEYQALTIPGGFSYGDDISAGRILAAQLERCLDETIRDFVARGSLVLGICNGFQVLVKAGLLPCGIGENGQRGCTITYNDPPGFKDRWVHLRANVPQCAFLEHGKRYELPIAHGEGRVRFSDELGLKRALAANRAALLYVAAEGDSREPSHATDAEFSLVNPNGSDGDIAGMCDQTGRILGLMPHPERFVSGTQHPCWTSRAYREDGDGLAIFRRAYDHVRRG